MEGRRVLLTGGTGHLGSYILRQLILSEYREIVATKRKTSSMAMAGKLPEYINWIECDLEDEVTLNELVSQCDVIIHAAGMISFTSSQKQQMYKTNVEGTTTLINLALIHNIEKFIYISSVAALGPGNENHLISEETEWVDSPFNSHYAISKQYAEREVWRGHIEGLNTVIISPSFIIGAGPWDYGPLSIFQTIYKGIRFYPPGSTGVVDVRDVAEIVVKCVELDQNPCKLIVSAENLAYVELMTLIAKEFGRKPPAHQMPGWIGKWIVPFQFLFGNNSSMIKEETIRISFRNLRYDNQKAKDLLNVRYIPAEKTIRDTCNAFLKTYPSRVPYAIF